MYRLPIYVSRYLLVSFQECVRLEEHLWHRPQTRYTAGCRQTCRSSSHQGNPQWRLGHMAADHQAVPCPGKIDHLRNAHQSQNKCRHEASQSQQVSRCSDDLGDNPRGLVVGVIRRIAVCLRILSDAGELRHLTKLPGPKSSRCLTTLSFA